MAGGAVYGMCKAALERFSTGLAAEAFDDDIAVNALSPTRFGRYARRRAPQARQARARRRYEPMERMVEAAYALCTGDPAVLTGKVTYAVKVVKDLGLVVPTPS